MKAYILRRRKLGRTSCKEISKQTDKRIISRRDAVAIKEDADIVFRWGCTSNIPCKNVVNTAEAIHEVNDKMAFRMVMDKADLCPETYTNAEECEDNYPLVVRPKTHSRGKHLYVVKNRVELMTATRKCGAGWYASPLINKTEEFRVFIVQGRAVAVAKKTPGNPEDVAWNVAKGGRFDNVSWDDWNLKVVRYAIEAFNLSKLDFGGVDVMLDGAGNVYVIEINSAPSLTSEYRQQCFAKAFDHILINGKERMVLKEKKGGYRKFIHPAICDNAE